MKLNNPKLDYMWCATIFNVRRFFGVFRRNFPEVAGMTYKQYCEYAGPFKYGKQ